MENNQKEIILLKDLGYLYPTETSKRKSRFALYKCFCGNEFKTITQSIKSGHTKSCGCLIKEKNSTHKLSKHKIYQVWLDMARRCNNPKRKEFKNYGGRGITVCDRWLNVANFIEDMYPLYKEGLTLDRINVDGNYEKSNCRWATKAIQSRNTSKIRANNTTGYRGIYFFNKKYCARIRFKNNDKFLGTFNTAIEAAKAYDNYIIENDLEHTRNFS